MLSTYPYRFVMNEPLHDDYIICTHHYNIDKSAYILINKNKLKETPTLIQSIEQFFIDIYPSLED